VDQEGRNRIEAIGRRDRRALPGLGIGIAVGHAARDVEVLVVAPERRDVRQEEVRHEHGLRPAQMRVGGHDRLDVRLGPGEQQLLELAQGFALALDHAAQVKPHVGHHLVVAAARRVKLGGRRAAQLGQAALDRHVAELESLYADAPVGLAVFDAFGRYVRVNRRLAEINGLPVAELIGRTYWEVLPDLAPTLEPLFRGVLDTGEPAVNVEIHGTTPAQPGVPRDWLASYYPLRTAGSGVVGVHLVVQEITERKRAEERLRMAHAELATIHAHAPMVFLVVDEDLRVRKVNEAAVRFAGRPEADMLGLRPGGSVGCLNSLKDPKGRGHGPACGTCPLRLAVLDSIRDLIENPKRPQQWIKYLEEPEPVYRAG